MTKTKPASKTKITTVNKRSSETVSDQSLKRLSLKAGAPKLGRKAGALMRKKLDAHMEELMRDIVLRTENNNMRTITPEVVGAAIERITGERVYA